MVPSLPLAFAGLDVEALEFVLVCLPLTRGTLEGLPSPAHLNVAETSLLDRRQVLSFQESAPDSGGPDRDVFAARGGTVLVNDDVGDLETAAGSQYDQATIIV